MSPARCSPRRTRTAFRPSSTPTQPLPRPAPWPRSRLPALPIRTGSSACASVSRRGASCAFRRAHSGRTASASRFWRARRDARAIPGYGAPMSERHERLLIVDFGSQVTQLIARRVRESGVYCEIHPFDRVDAGFLDRYDPKAIVLSGGPASAHEAQSPAADPHIFGLGVPVLGICYGEMTMCATLGGAVESGHSREFGRAEIRIVRESPLLAGLGDVGHEEPVWMSHGDKITAIPPGFEVAATSDGSPFAVIADEG